MMSSKTYLTDRAEEEAIRWLARLNSPQLTPKEEQAFTQWLELSPLHQAAYIKAEQLWERGAVLNRLPDVKKSQFAFNQWHGWALACSCIFAVASVLFFQLGTASTHNYQTAIGEQRDVQLEDGSHILLNTNSKLNIEFTRKKRIAYLTQGEVFFDIHKDGRSFDVITDNGVVRVLGTHFSVFKNTADTLVTVIEGRVALGQSSATQEFTTQAILQANERLSLAAAKIGQTPEKLNANSALAWRKKQLVFKGQTLNQVIAELTRYFPATITLEQPELGNREITAVVQLLDAKSTLNALAQPLHLDVDVDNTGNRFTIRAQTK